MRPKLERVVYPAVRELYIGTPTAAVPDPNFWSLDHDDRNWVRQGKGFTMYKNERTYYESPKSASATDFYNTDQSSKMSLGHRVQRSPYRYVAMRQQSGGRSSLAATGMSERVGPGAYSPHSFVHPRHAPYGSAFASGVPWR